jgi:hypothetical protein
MRDTDTGQCGNHREAERGRRQTRKRKQPASCSSPRGFCGRQVHGTAEGKEKAA